MEHTEQTSNSQAAPSPSPQGHAERYQATAWSDQRLYRPYVRWALLVALTLGFSTGTAMLLLPALEVPLGSTWLTHTQAHGIAQIFGWAGLFVMGVAYHVVPRFRNGPMWFPWPQRLVLALVLVGITLRFLGQTLPVAAGREPLLLASGVVLVMGMTLFAAIMARTLLRGTASRSLSEAWIWAALFWSLVAATLHVIIVTQMANNQLIAAPYRWNAALVHAGLLGFIGNFIFGVSVRAVPAFLGLPPSRPKLAALALGAVNLGIAGTVAGWHAAVPSWWPTIGPLLELLGFIILVAAIRLYSRRDRRRPYTLGAYGRYEWYVRAAYGWLLVAGALLAWGGLANIWPVAGFPVNLASPALHVVALGFVTMMIMGISSRMLPIFEGSILPRHWLMDAVFVLLNGSVLTRLVFGILPLPGAWAGLAASGVLGTLALMCFSIVVWGTLRPSARRRYAEMAQAFGQQQLVQIRRRQGQANPEGDGTRNGNAADPK